MRREGGLLLLGHHEIPDQAQSRIATSHQIADKSNKKRIIPPQVLPGYDNSSHVGKETEEDTTEKGSQTKTPKQDFFSEDIKFITAVVFGFVIIIALVYLIPRVRTPTLFGGGRVGGGEEGIV